jgi:hypothetical protein
MTGMNLVRNLCFLYCLFLSPILSAEPLTILQLEDKLAIQSRGSDKKLAKLIGKWELSERLPACVLGTMVLWVAVLGAVVAKARGQIVAILKKFQKGVALVLLSE